MTALTGLVVRELVPDLRDDYLTFFDPDAFPYWSSCYCTFYNDPENDGNASPEMRDVRRPRGIELVRSGQTRGLLAYDGERVIGWCNAGSTMCFVVAAPYHGKGVAAALFDAACKTFRSRGLHIAEGYPMTAEPTVLTPRRRPGRPTTIAGHFRRT